MARIRPRHSRPIAPSARLKHSKRARTPHQHVAKRLAVVGAFGDEMRRGDGHVEKGCVHTFHRATRERPLQPPRNLPETVREVRGSILHVVVRGLVGSVARGIVWKGGKKGRKPDFFGADAHKPELFSIQINSFHTTPSRNGACIVHQHGAKGSNAPT